LSKIPCGRTGDQHLAPNDEAAKLRRRGRGMTPVWMREEMKGTKLTKDSFLIK
jgi:hypothetical protein